jgi:hypothetical protein
LQADLHEELRSRRRRDQTMSFLDDLMLANESHLQRNRRHYSTAEQGFTSALR